MSTLIASYGKRILVAGLFCSYMWTPYAQEISPRRLVEVVDFSSPVVSPDGSMVAYRAEQASVERNVNEAVWYVQALTGASPPRKVADGGVLLREPDGTATAELPVWSGDGRWIYYRALLDGKVDVWRAAVDGSAAEPMTGDPADVRGFRLSDDGRSLLYRVGASREEVLAAEQAEYDGGVLIDESIPIGQGLFRSGDVAGRLATQRLRENEVTRYPLLSGAPDRWKEMDLMTGRRRNLEASEIPREPPSTPVLAKDANQPWKTVTDAGSGRIALLTFVESWDGLSAKPAVELAVQTRLRSKALTKCLSDDCVGKPISNIQWRPGRNELLFTVTDTDRSQAQSIFRWDVSTGAVVRVASSAGLLNGGRDPYEACGVSKEVLVCVAARADHPPRIERIDLDSGRLQVLFDPNAALGLDMARTPAQLLQWTDPAGHQFNGQYFPARHAAGQLPPLFITYYRCSGFIRGGAGDEWPLATLASFGISALCINAAPTRLDAVERYDTGRSAVESVVELLALAGEIDRTKVGMGGLSFGAEVTLWTAMNSSVLSAASVSSPPMTPLAYLFMSMHGDSYRSRLLKVWQLAAPDETPERWHRLSPTFNLARIGAPILMQLPEQEYLHSLDYAIPLVRDLRADLYAFPNEPHIKFQPRHKLSVYERNVDWFRFWLQGREDAEPRKAGQYARWRLMRARASGRAAQVGVVHAR